MTPPTPLPELRISCHASRCGKDVAAADRRHAFTPTIGQLPGIGGTCRACGADVVDWRRHHLRDPGDVDALVAAMRQELIRDVYWSASLPERIVRLALARSPDKLRASQAALLRRVLVPTEAEYPFLRKQTFFGDHHDARVVHCAQHATATCCRGCLEKWHGLPRDERVSDRDLAYLEGLVWRYTEQRLAEPQTGRVRAAA